MLEGDLVLVDSGDLSLGLRERPDGTLAFNSTAFIEALERAGVRVGDRATGPNPLHLLPHRDTYRESQRVAEYVSVTLKELIRLILKVSHGPGADLAVKVGSRSCEDGLEREFAFFTGLPVSVSHPIARSCFDGAGADERNRTTPAAMTSFLRALANNKPSYGAAFRQGLPVLGVDGTLAQTQPGSPAALPGRATPS